MEGKHIIVMAYIAMSHDNMVSSCPLMSYDVSGNGLSVTAYTVYMYFLSW